MNSWEISHLVCLYIMYSYIRHNYSPYEIARESTYVVSWSTKIFSSAGIYLQCLQLLLCKVVFNQS
ncbi:hypothetical protein Hanom_Chr16g01457541 [Helianthus anomalus]